MIFKVARAAHSPLFIFPLVILCLLTLSPACLGKVRYGMVLAQSNYYSANGEFVDMLVHANNWKSVGAPAGYVQPLTATGYPSSGRAFCIVCPMGYQSGIANFYGKGDFTLTMNGGNLITLVPGTFHKQDNITRCQFKITVPPPSFPGQHPWALMGVSDINPLNPPDDFHLICPGRYKAWPETQEVFTDEFLAAERPFSIWRMAVDRPGGAQDAAFLAETDWDTRVNPNIYSQWGNSFEAGIAYCNATMTDFWANIPVNATANWGTGLATLIHKSLNPKLHVYIEFSNECWNYNYASWAIVEKADKANPALDSSVGAWARHNEEVAYKLMQFYQVMHPILGSQARFVFMGQLADATDQCAPGLAWISKNYGPPSNYLYGIGGATYVSANPAMPYTDTPGLFASMNSYLQSLIVPQLQQYRKLADQYGLKLVCYEGGQGLVAKADGSDLNFLTSAELDPGMANFYANLGAALERPDIHADEQLLTCDCLEWESGFWGMVSDIRECAAGTSPKWNAAVALAKAGAQSPARDPVPLTAAQKRAAAKAAEEAAKAKHHKK